MKMNWKKFYQIVLLLVFAVSGCTFDGGNTPILPDDLRIPYNPTPADNAVDQPLALALKWSSKDAVLFDVYLDTSNPPTVLKYSNVDTAKAVVVAGLKNSTTYYWRIVAKFSDGSSLDGPVWKFTTIASNTGSAGYVLIDHQLYTELPHIVNILFQVLDLNGKGVDNLTETDFELLEDGVKIDPAESELKIFKKDQTPYEFRTILMLDNSTSLAPQLDAIKKASIDFVNNLITGQKVAIYAFSEEAVLLQDFTDNVSLLTSAINSLNIGFASTNLYGAVITGASRMEDIFTVDNIVQSAMILFTDGKDTQGSRTLSEATSAISGKRVYTVGLGTNIDPIVLDLLGTAGFYSLANVSDLSATFLTIGQELDKFSNSFYWLRYRSPKRGNFTHTLTLQIINNPNTGAGSFISGNFSSAGFFSILPGLYFNSSSSNPEGIDTVYLFIGSGSQVVQASSYLVPNPPAFGWSQPDTNIAKLEVFATDDSRATIYPGRNKGVTSTLVSDVKNPGVSKTLYIKVN